MEEKTEFKFWKDNKIDGVFKMNLEEIKKAFLEWLKTKDFNWLTYYSYSPTIIPFFIGEKEEKKGLQSVCENEDYDILWPHLSKIKNEYIKSLKN